MTTADAIGEVVRHVGSTEKLSSNLKVSFHAVYSWLHGKRNPSRIHRAELARIARKAELPSWVLAALEDPTAPVHAP